jgi:hypothetical protein
MSESYGAHPRKCYYYVLLRKGLKTSLMEPKQVNGGITLAMLSSKAF